ncbi:MAG: hypothetical protein KDA42_08300 [Planctomycetales bacterium]|nr:hypothetical protein [Planctomycetales bacterium]
MTRLILGCVLCLGLWLASAPVRAQQAAPFRTDESTDDKLPWFQLVAGEFPPAGSAHYFSGELIRVDAIERTFVLRVDRTDKQNRSHFDLPIAATMLPFGAVAYHGAPAALRDVPIGTHLHGWFYEKDPNDDTKPLEIFHNRRSYEVDFNRCFRLEDDFSYYTAKQQFWRIDGVDRETQKLTATLVADDKPIGEPQEFDLQTTTRVWRGSGFARQEELAAGQMVQFNLTWATLYGPGRLVEIWLDEASRQQATAHQLEVHRQTIRQRGLAGWVDAVDNQQRIVTITFFGGVDPKLLEEIVVGQSAGIAVALDNLNTYDPVNDRKSGPVLAVEHVPIEPGSSGLQVQIQPGLLLEGYRPQRIVRVYPSGWPVIALPREEQFFGR